MQLSVAYICIRRTKALKRIGAPSPLLEDGGDTVPKMSWYTAEGAAQTSFFFFFYATLVEVTAKNFVSGRNKLSHTCKSIEIALVIVFKRQHKY